jgi:hypothetical protein
MDSNPSDIMHSAVPASNRQPMPEVPQVVSDHAQPKAHPVRAKAVATQPPHLYRMLVFLFQSLSDLRYLRKAFPRSGRLSASSTVA